VFRKIGRCLTAASVVAAFGAAWMCPVGSAAGAVTIAAMRPLRVAAPKEDSDRAPWLSKCPKGMTSQHDAHFYVWACNNGPGAALDESAALSLADSIYEPITSYLGGLPLPDSGGTAGGGSPEIDIYLTGIGQVLHRENRPTSTKASIPSCAAPAGREGVAPWDPKTYRGPGKTESSGYIVISRPLLDKCANDFASVLAHEFFHVVTYRYNTVQTCPNFWFSEASASWAEWYFEPGSAAAEVYPYFAAFQHLWALTLFPRGSDQVIPQVLAVFLF
jgi:hypothetical protein